MKSFRRMLERDKKKIAKWKHQNHFLKQTNPSSARGIDEFKKKRKIKCLKNDTTINLQTNQNTVSFADKQYSMSKGMT